MWAKLLVPALAAAFAGCGQSGGSGLGLGGGSVHGAIVAGLPSIATKNTARIGGSNATADAAAVALAVYPGAPEQPRAVALADVNHWRAALVACSLMGPPLHAPLLLTDGSSIPATTGAALAAMHPTQLIRVGATAQPGGAISVQIGGHNINAVAAGVAAYVAATRSTADNRVVVVSADSPQYAMPAAAWAAETGDPILFVTRDAVPSETRDAIARLQQPRIYVLGPDSVIGPGALRVLNGLGTVKRIFGPDPVSNAVAFARYADGDFGWGIVDPGHGLVFANDSDPNAASAAAALSASGARGPLLLVDRPDVLPAVVGQFLLDIQPGYQNDPAHGVYNHAWLIGDENAISASVQAEIDGLLEIVPVSSGVGNLPTVGLGAPSGPVSATGATGATGAKGATGPKGARKTAPKAAAPSTGIGPLTGATTVAGRTGRRGVSGSTAGSGPVK